jgi:hypothetical protein
VATRAWVIESVSYQSYYTVKDGACAHHSGDRFGMQSCYRSARALGARRRLRRHYEDESSQDCGKGGFEMQIAVTIRDPSTRYRP